jgi:hypothetical protein
MGLVLDTPATPRSSRWGSVLARAATTTLLLSGLTACYIEPLPSNESSISGTWTIDSAPPTAASCNAVGIDQVELVIFAEGDVTPMLRLRQACSVGRIDSRLSPEVFIYAGDYEVVFEGYSGATRVTQSDRAGVRLPAGDRATVSTNYATGGGFDPRGSDATLAASWTIDGLAPSSATCNALGVTDIRVAFQNGATYYEHPDLVFPCSVGNADTRPVGVIRSGTWTLQVQALDASGAIVAMGMSATLTVTPGSHVIMDPIDFTGGAFNPLGSDATVESSWQLNGRVPTADSCYAVGIDRVRFVLFAASDVAFENGVVVFQEMCATGRRDSRPMPLVRAGRYLWAFEAIDSTGVIVNEYSEMTPIDVPVSSHIQLPIVDFPFPTTLTIGLDWQSGVAGGYTTCSGAGVATYSYTLRREGSIIATADARPCADLISFNSTDTAGFAPGNYALYFEGFNGAGRKQWAVDPLECTGIRVDNNELALDTCGAIFTP